MKAKFDNGILNNLPPLPISYKKELWKMSVFFGFVETSG